MSGRPFPISVWRTGALRSAGTALGVTTRLPILPNQNYVAGRSFEYAIMRRLRLAGYWVLRSAGSKGPVDVIALKGSMVWPQLFIQCKRGKGIPSAESWNLLYDLAAGRDAIPLLASRSSEKGNRQVQYQRLMGRRLAGERTADLLTRYNPFGQLDLPLDEHK